MNKKYVFDMNDIFHKILFLAKWKAVETLLPANIMVVAKMFYIC